MRISSLCFLNLLLSPQLNANAKSLRGLKSGEQGRNLNIFEPEALNTVTTDTTTAADTTSINQVGNDVGGAYYSNSGTSVALSSDGAFLAVGATGSYGYSGHVEIHRFDKDTQSWVQQGQNIKGETGLDESGSSISFSNDGNRIAIGAPNNRGYYGHTRVYEFNSDSDAWVQLGDDLDGDRRDGHSGSSVALSGDGKRLIIGAPRDDTYSGHAKIYELVNNGESSTASWVQLGATLEGDDYYTSLGNTVAMSDSGHRIVIGAHYDSLNGDRFVGSVGVFEFVSEVEEWVLVGSELKGEGYFDLFGHSVDMSGDGNRIVIGTPNEDYSVGEDDGNMLHNVGKAEVYEYNSELGDWELFGNAMLGDVYGEQLGQTVSISGDGDRIVLGSGFCDGGGNDAGCTWVYDYDQSTNTWSQFGNTIYGEFAGDRSGKAVAISADGEYFAVGSPNHKYYAGHTRVYKIGDDNDDESTSSVPSSSPSQTPSRQEQHSASPSVEPSSSPSEFNPCEDPSHRLLSIEITTDEHGEQDNWFIVKSFNKAAGKFNRRVFRKNKLTNSQTKTYEKCLPVDACYTFTLFDRSQDGMCCEHGAGSFTVTWDGELINEGRFQNGKRTKPARFGDTCDNVQGARVVNTLGSWNGL